MKFYAIVVAIPLIAYATGYAPGARITMSDFKLSADRYDVAGKHATFMAELVQLKQMTATMNQGAQTVKLASPRCSLDRVNRRATSRSTVQITSDKVTMTGRGFDVDFERQRVRVRRDVRMVIRHGAEISHQLLGKGEKSD